MDSTSKTEVLQLTTLKSPKGDSHMRNPRLTLQDLAEDEEWARQVSGLHGTDGWLVRRWRMDDMSTTGAPHPPAQEPTLPSVEPEKAEPTIQRG